MIECDQRPFHLQILDGAKYFAEDIALTDRECGRDMSFKDLRENSYKFADGLSSLGALKGNIICVALMNCSSYAIVFLGGALVGCSITGINPESTKFEIESCIDLTRAKFLVISSDQYSRVLHLRDRLSLIILNKTSVQYGVDFCDLISKSKLNYLVQCTTEISLNDIILSPLSSGTSGSPKCVQLSHHNFNASTAILKRALFDVLSAGKRRETIGLLPFYHVSGFWALCFCLLEGHRTIVLQGFNPGTLLRCVEEYKPFFPTLVRPRPSTKVFAKTFKYPSNIKHGSMSNKSFAPSATVSSSDTALSDVANVVYLIDTLNLVPSIVSFLCKSDKNLFNFDVSSLDTVLCGSASLGKELSKQFLERYYNVKNLVQGYGLTEIVVLSHIIPLGVSNSKFGSCGKLMPGFKAKLVDIEIGEEISKSNFPGELLLKSDAVMKGYLNNKRATEEAIDKDGWLHTGDVLYFDDEGYYYVVDRLKDIIKVNGQQVSPSELEDVLLSHTDVSEAAVIGIADEIHGQIPRAFVVLKSAICDEKVEDIKEYLQERVAPFKYLKGGIFSVESLPKTPSGKVRKQVLLKLKIRTTLQDVQDPLNKSLRTN